MNYNRGLALRILGKYEDSIAAFRQAYYPDGDTRIHLAIALVRLGRIDEAKAEVKLIWEERSEIHRRRMARRLVLQRPFDCGRAKSPIWPRRASRKSDFRPPIALTIHQWNTRRAFAPDRQ